MKISANIQPLFRIKKYDNVGDLQIFYLASPSAQKSNYFMTKTNPALVLLYEHMTYKYYPG